MIYIRGDNNMRAIIGIAGEPKVKDLVSKNGNAFTLCEVSVTTGVNNVDGKSLFTTVKGFGYKANDLAELRKGDWVLVVGEEKTETWEGRNGKGSRTVVEAREVFCLKKKQDHENTAQNRNDEPKTKPASIDDLTVTEDDMPF